GRRWFFVPDLWEHACAGDGFSRAQALCRPSVVPAGPVGSGGSAQPTGMDQIIFDDLGSLFERRSWLDRLIVTWIAGLSAADLNLVLSYKSTTMNEQNEQRSEEHTSELQSRENLVCRLL